MTILQTMKHLVFPGTLLLEVLFLVACLVAIHKDFHLVTAAFAGACMIIIFAITLLLPTTKLRPTDKMLFP